MSTRRGPRQGPERNEEARSRSEVDVAGNGSERSKAFVLPNDALPCDWMTAGLVAYKLCDRGFDCEHCPFDAAMRGMKEKPPAASADIQEPRWEFRADRRYHAKHGWVLRIDASHVRYGLDVFAARLLRHASAVVLPRPKAHVRRDQAGCWIKHAEALIALAAPISGVAVRINQRVQASPRLIAGTPYDDGWLLEIEHDPDQGSAGLLTADDMRRQCDRQLRELAERAGRQLHRDFSVGPTLHDGGDPVPDLWRVLGTKRYHDLIWPLLV